MSFCDMLHFLKSQLIVCQSFPRQEIDIERNITISKKVDQFESCSNTSGPLLSPKSLKANFQLQHYYYKIFMVMLRNLDLKLCKDYALMSDTTQFIYPKTNPQSFSNLNCVLFLSLSCPVTFVSVDKCSA